MNYSQAVIEVAGIPVKAYQDSEGNKYLEQWNDTRKFTTRVHSQFQTMCEKVKCRANVVHDAMTKAICGLTAKQLREKFELVGKNKQVGLDHLPIIEAMEKVALTKYHFANVKKCKDWKERLEKALLKAEKEMKKGRA